MKKIEDNKDFEKESKEIHYRGEDIIIFLKEAGFEPTEKVYLGEDEKNNPNKNIHKLDVVVVNNASEYQLARINVDEFHYEVKLPSKEPINFDEKWQNYLLEYCDGYAPRLRDHLAHKVSIGEKNVNYIKQHSTKIAEIDKQIEKLQKQIEGLQKQKLNFELTVESYTHTLNQNQKRLSDIEERIAFSKQVKETYNI